MPARYRGLVDERKIKAGVERARRALRPDVVRILYSFDEDWTGRESLFFKIILSDAAAEPKGLGEVIQRIERRIKKEIKADELIFFPYFNYRSESEQAELRELSWER